MSQQVKDLAAWGPDLRDKKRELTPDLPNTHKINTYKSNWVRFLNSQCFLLQKVSRIDSKEGELPAESPLWLLNFVCLPYN